MKFSNAFRRHWAAVRALAVLTVIFGAGYPLLVWLVAQAPGLHDRAQGSIIEADGRPVGSALIGQSFTDATGDPLPQYFQSRPSVGGYDPLATGGSNLGPESIVDTPADPAQLARGVDPAAAGFSPSLLTQVCARSAAIGERDGVDGSRPFCTGSGVGAVLAVLGPRDQRGTVSQPTRVISLNEPCAPGDPSPERSPKPFLERYAGVGVECARFGEDYSTGQIVPIRGSAPEHPQVPADAVTASASGLDPDISWEYAAIQIARVAAARHIGEEQVRAVVAAHRHGRALGILGEPRVDVLGVNVELDREYPLPGRPAGG